MITWKMMIVDYCHYRNPSLGFTTKARVCKVAGQERSRESHNVLPGMWEGARERTLTPQRSPLWELESWWTPKFSEGDFRGQNSMAWGVLYINEKLLKCKYLKWARIAHLDIWNISYGQKKGQESNWQFDSWPVKVGNRPDLRAWKWHAKYRWKALDEGYNFALDLISIKGLLAKLWRPKVVGVPTLAISGLPLGSPGTKSHLYVGLVERCKVYYKGEGGGFPQVQAVVSLMCPCCPWLVLAPKVLQLCTNHLVLVLCRSVWVSEAC
jgi:hypothetical protein